MRVTVGRKITLAFAVILLTGILSMLIIYRGLSILQQAMHELADIKEPISAAAYEMEINVNGIGLGVLKYLDNADPTYRELVEDDEKDFEHFHRKYLQLTQTEEAQELGKRVGFLYKEFQLLGQTLMRLRDEQEGFLHTVGKHFESIDAIIDEHLQPKLAPRSNYSAEKLARVQDLESDIAEVGLWLLRYQRSQRTEDKRLLLHHEQEFRDTLAQFHALSLSETERFWASTLEGNFNQAMVLTHQVLALEEQLRLQTRQFVHLRLAIDAIVDEEIQTLAMRELFTPRRQADRETSQIIGTVLILLPIFALSVFGVAVLMIRTITRPVQALIYGTHAVSRGELHYRVAPLGRSEFGELATHFNHMVAELQATTVSKALLQESEAKLRDTVDEVRREMTARERMEAERIRLQASLRRSEIMATTGLLVLGVAHEVRNPLFAISSTLDAFEARFPARQEYQRYIGVLRTEVHRLTALMQALLDYGKPPTLDLVLDSPQKAFALARRLCMPLATRMHVRLHAPACRDLGLIHMDRQRLVQVFQNLLENAIQHSSSGACVVVEAAVVSLDGREWISYTIKDSGPGVHPEDLPRIFEPFFTRRRGGTGLGMSIVQRIVEEHGGSVWAGNHPEGGAMIVVRFPLIERLVLKEQTEEGPCGTAQDLGG
jgi:signal transduction histidine kinase